MSADLVATESHWKCSLKCETSAGSSQGARGARAATGHGQEPARRLRRAELGAGFGAQVRASGMGWGHRALPLQRCAKAWVGWKLPVPAVRGLREGRMRWQPPLSWLLYTLGSVWAFLGLWPGVRDGVMELLQDCC